MKTLRKGIAVLLSVTMASILGVGSALAQGTTSRVVGNVLDPNGAAVADAIVTLTNEATQVSFTTNTTSGGTYVFDSVQVGTYTVTVEKAGFKKLVSAGNVLSIGQPTTVNVNLELGQVAETEFYFDLATRGAAFVTATNTRGIFSIPEPGKLGNTGRNFFTTPGFFNLNLSVGKKLRISENQNLEYRLEMQNATNTPSFGLPENGLAAGNTITNTAFGRARGNTTSSARKIQMALKYNF